MVTRAGTGTAGPGTDTSLLAGLRAEALAFKRRSPRGLVPPAVRVGRPGGMSTCPVPVADVTDAHLRVEVAVVLCDSIRDRVPAPMLWLTRTGTPEPVLLDQAWWAAARAAWEEQGLSPSFAVVTRHGWRLEPAGVRREWRRLR